MDGLCTMEMVAWLAGEEHTDEPACTCPVLAAYARGMNDALPDDASRHRFMRPLVPKLIDTRRSRALASERAMAALDHALRVLGAILLESRDGNIARFLRNMQPLREPLDARLALIDTKNMNLPRPLTWMLEMAARGVSPLLWVQTCAQVMSLCGPAGFRCGANLILRLADSGVQAKAS